MLWSAAGHTVKYSVERFRIADLIDTNGWESCKKGRNCPAYFDEMYRFLVWKLGTPALGAAQWLSAGYEHFDKAYSDEAAGILLGLIDFRNVKPEIVMPVWLQEYMQSAGVEMTAAGIAAFLMSKGLDEQLAAEIGKRLAKWMVSRVPVAVYLPKEYDIDNSLIEAVILAKRQWRDKRVIGISPAGPLWVPNVRRAAKPVRRMWRSGIEIGGRISDRDS